MSIDGLNVFGSLTVNGKKLSLEEFDINNDQVISKEEFNLLLNKVEVDTIEFSTIDTNNDGKITEEEFADFEKKSQIQEELNTLQATIAKDFTGANAKYASDCMAKLRDFAKEFVNNYTGEGDIVADFKAALPAKYEEIKNDVLANTPEAKAKKAEEEKQGVKSKVLDELFESIKNEVAAAHPELADSITNAIVKKLEVEANAFLKTYTGDNLEADLKAHLESYMDDTSADKLKDEVESFKATVDAVGGFIDEKDLEVLKSAAKELLVQAAQKGFTFELNGIKLSTEARIDNALKGFTDGQALIDAVESLLSSLSTESLKDAIINEKVAEKEEAEAKAFAELKGEDVQIETEGKINFNNISGYYDNTKVECKGKHCIDDAKRTAVSFLENNLKAQFKAQVKADLIAKGVPADKLDQVFENIFTQSAWETADACVARTNKRWLNKNKKAGFNTKDLVDKFIEIFNQNMAATIGEMNKSNTDMDLQDVDWGHVADENSEIAKAIESGETLEIKGEGSAYYVEMATEMINKLKSTMMSKAMAMCKANGIEFNKDAFDNIFDNAKGLAVVNNTDGRHGTWFRKSKSTFNPQQMLKDFATNFESSYTAWVESQKTKVATPENA